MLPRGILRQPLSSLKRASVFVLTKTNLNLDYQDIKDFLNEINPRALLIESIHKPLGFYRLDEGNDLLSPDTLKEKTVTVFSGIGDPDSFENLIISLGINIGLSFRFSDHHHYSPKDLENIVIESQKKIDTIITTEKDAVRLSHLSIVPCLPEQVRSCQLSVLILRIELKITKDEQGFYSRLLGLYSI
jgi:tetraacyldisaccharide 4'-kinase